MEIKIIWLINCIHLILKCCSGFKICFHPVWSNKKENSKHNLYLMYALQFDNKLLKLSFSHKQNKIFYKHLFVGRSTEIRPPITSSFLLFCPHTVLYSFCCTSSKIFLLWCFLLYFSFFALCLHFVQYCSP